MNEVTFYNNSEFGTLRQLSIEGEPWFVGKDVAEALGYKIAQKAIRDHVDEEDVLKWNTPTASGIQKMLLVN